MSGAITAVAVGTIGSAIVGNQQAKAAEGAANAQKKSIDAATDVERERLQMEYQQYQQQMAEYQRKQAMYEKQQAQTQVMLAPYMQSGQGALYEMMALTGLSAPTGASMPDYRTPTTGVLSSTPKTPTATTTPGRMGILSNSMFPGVKSVAGSATTTGTPGEAILQQELQKGGRSLSSSAWSNVDPAASQRAMAANAWQSAKSQGLSDADAYYSAAAMLDDNISAAQREQILSDARNQVVNIEPAVNPYAGMTGTEAQQSAIQRISESPLLQELMSQGETGILQNAAATGGLRGGRTQAALAQFRPAMLQQEIDKQYARLQGISGLGQQSILSSPTMAGGTMPAGGYDTSTLSGLLSQSGAAQAGGILSRSAIQGNTLADIGQIAGWGLEKYGQGGFFPTGGSNVNYGSLGIGNPANY